jgi:hypothetical protein
MPYGIHCEEHGVSPACDILDLIEKHTDARFGKNGGRIMCPVCKKPATVSRVYKLQEGHPWECWITEVVRIPSDVETYVPYVLFTKSSELGCVSDGVMVSYYKDTRRTGGRLKHGHGPGGPAVLGREELKTLIRYLLEEKLVSDRDLQGVLAEARNVSP